MDESALLQHYRSAVDRGSIFSKTDPKGVIIYVNDLFCDISGYSRDELVGKPHNIIRHPDMAGETFRKMWETIQKGEVWSGVIKNRKKDGSAYYVSTVIVPHVEEGEIVEYLSVRQDISESIRKDELIQFYTTDPLTNLPNRQRLRSDLLEQKEAVMLAFVDIKDFGRINDLYGEKVGDGVLQYVAERLKGLIYNGEAALYKFCGDKYAVMVPNPNHYEKYENLLRYSLLMEEDAYDDSLDLAYTVGIAYGGEEAFQKADIALKNAKSQRKDMLKYDISSQVEAEHVENMQRLKRFRHALQEGNIIPYFQPIVDAANGKVVKYEAIARLIDETGKVVTPLLFLDVAKESRLFGYFSRLMLQQIFHIASQNPVPISINVTYDDIADEEFVAYVVNRLETHKVPEIIFEILESEEVVDYAVIEHFIAAVRPFGCKIAIDDFGSGYSNFTRIIKLDSDYVKIDGSIIRRITHDPDARMATRIIVEMAKEKKIKTVAEFVYDEAVAEMAKKLGVDYLQGYCYGQPRPAEYYGLKS